MRAGSAFVYHLAEGTDPVLIAEYELARARKILRPRFCGIHCTALGEPQFDEWEDRRGDRRVRALILLVHGALILLVYSFK
jgi:hypothetical protein